MGGGGGGGKRHVGIHCTFRSLGTHVSRHFDSQDEVCLDLCGKGSILGMRDRSFTCSRCADRCHGAVSTCVH